MAKNPVDEAEALFARRRWADLISLLEPLSSVYRENARFSVLLGAAYLHKEDTGGAFSCFRRAQSLDFRDVDAALGLAAVYIRRGETDKAVQCYIDILERHPGHAKARRALDYLRTAQADAGGPSSSARMARLYPGPKPRYGRLAVLAAALAACVGLVLAAPLAVGFLRDLRPAREGVKDIALTEDEAKSPVGSTGGFTIVLTEKDAVAAFDKAKRLFAEYRDEAALVELNRLLLSNASWQVKAKAEALAQYAREPSFLALPDRFGYAEVSAFPRLYEGVAVSWKGLPANHTSGEGASSFDLLVGYHDKNRLEGIVRVKAGFETKLLADEAVEVLAKVRVSPDGSFYLECFAIHEL